MCLFSFSPHCLPNAARYRCVHYRGMLKEPAENELLLQLCLHQHLNLERWLAASQSQPASLLPSQAVDQSHPSTCADTHSHIQEQGGRAGQETGLCKEIFTADHTRVWAPCRVVGNDQLHDKAHHLPPAYRLGDWHQSPSDWLVSQELYLLVQVHVWVLL